MQESWTILEIKFACEMHGWNYYGDDFNPSTIPMDHPRDKIINNVTHVSHHKLDLSRAHIQRALQPL